MITSLDTSVILDVLIDDPRFYRQSEQAIRKARSEGKLIICECVLAEILPALGDPAMIENLLSDWQIEYSPLTKESALLAGCMNTNYLKRNGSAKRVLPDFLIGAHASLQAERLLARDRGYYRDYFTSLTLWDPSQTDPD